MTRRAVRLHLLGAGLLALATGDLTAAETLYVTSRLQAGVHSGQTLQSAVVALVPSGAAVEVQERSGALVRVRVAGEKSVEGWMDAAYLVPDAPVTPERLAAAEARVRALEAAPAGSPPEADADGAGGASLAAPSEIDDLRSRLASERLRAAELERRLAGTQRADRARSEDRATALSAENAALKREIEALRTPVQSADANLLQRLAVALVALLGVIGWPLLLGTVLTLIVAPFAAGLWCMDWMNRQRHGGFRV